MLHRPLACVLIASALVLSGAVGAEAGRRPGKATTAASLTRAKVALSKAREIVRAAKPTLAASAELPPASMSDRECLARAMYFESDRNEEDGMLAVGTIVTNRVASGRYGDTLCGVVSRYLQFAPGVLTRKMAEPKPVERAFRVADLVLAGARHPVAEDALFFHTANVPFRHDDKRYVLVSGGNAFYRWNRTGGRGRARANLVSLARASASAQSAERVGEAAIGGAANAMARVASAEPGPTAFRPVAAVTGTAEPKATAVFEVEGSGRIIPAAAEIAARRPDALVRALAYSGEPALSRQANAALAAVASLTFKSGPRVIRPSAPVHAAMGPAWPRPAAGPTPPPAPPAMSDPRANLVVAEAWSIFR